MSYHETKFRKIKCVYIFIIHYSNFIKTLATNFAFVRASHLKNIIQNHRNKRVFLNRSIEYFKISLSRSFIPPLLRKNYSHLPFLSSRRTQYIPLSSIFFSCPVRFFFTPFPSTQCPYTRTRTRRGRMLRVTK